MEQMMIEEFIPYGYKNRITRTGLHDITHLPDRVIRRQIEAAADRGILIASCDGGYFRRLSAEDDPYIQEYIARERKRFTTQSHKLKMLRHAMQEIDPDNDPKQVPGRMSFEW